MKKTLIVSMMLLCLAVQAHGECGGGKFYDREYEELQHHGDSREILTAIPATLGSDYIDTFDRYTCVIAPNGKPIHIVAQSEIMDEQIIRARNVLEHYLTDLPGSRFGEDKSRIADKMADNNAILLLMNGRDDGSNPAEVPGQPLYREEIQVEGHDWYINQDYDTHRDATFEEILHLVHDYGIGVDGGNSRPGALPEYQAEIRRAQQNALDKKLWGIGEDFGGMLEELAKENSLSQEYLAAVVDSYYGLWGAWTENDTHGMWGGYIAKTRGEVLQEDPMGSALMASRFFHPYLTYNASIHPDFAGVFSLRFDTDIPYTHHSQYLKDVTLTGTNDSGVQVNSLANHITGNHGVNTVFFSGNRDQYLLMEAECGMMVIDTQNCRDGVNFLEDIEILQFVDDTVELDRDPAARRWER